MYSQNAEESLILAACPCKHGKFLDIGAWNATDKSNTRALFEKGWDGVMVEPSPIPFANLQAEYGSVPDRIVLLNAAVALMPGTLRMWITPDCTSTSDPDTWRKWKNIVTYDDGIYEVRAITVDQIYSDHGPFDFVSIDTEGTSVDLFSQLISLGHRPRCICVEHDGRIAEIEQIGVGAGYDVQHPNGENSILVLR